MVIVPQCWSGTQNLGEWYGAGLVIQCSGFENRPSFCRLGYYYEKIIQASYAENCLDQLNNSLRLIFQIIT